MLKKISVYILSLILMLTMFPSNVVKADSYKQLVGNNVQIKSGFKFKSGINRDINFSSVAVFADTGEKVHGHKRGLQVGEPVVVKIPNGFKYMDGSTYDIYVEVSTTKTLSAGSEWVCKTVVSGDYDCLELSPFNMSVWSGDPFVTFNYKIYILDEKGNDAISNNDIDLTAGSCWTAVNEGARPWGNDNTIYTNIPNNILEYKTEVKAKNGTVYENEDANFWHITNGSYNQLRYYILGHGTTTENVKFYSEPKTVAKTVKANVIHGGYLRNSESGSAEMMFGYFLSASGNDYVGYYDGESHSISVDTDSSDAKVTYCKDSACKETYDSNPKFSDVGVYTVYYKVTGSGYKGEIGHHTVTIKKLPITITPTAHNKVYDGNTSATIDNVSNYKTGVKNETISISNFSGTFSDANVGTNKTVTINSHNDISYGNGAKASNYIITINNPKANITKADIVGVNASPYVGIYDGDSHNISVNNLPSDATIKYYKDAACNEEYTDLPVNVGTYTVYYKVTSSNTNYNELTGSSTVTINKKKIYLTPSAESRQYKQDDVSATVNDISATSTGVKNETISVSGLTGTFNSDEVGNNKVVNVDSTKASYTFSNNDADNYIVEINNTNANIYAATINDLKVTPYVGYYDGQSHNISVSGDYVGNVTYYAGECNENDLKETDSCEIVTGYTHVTEENNGIYTVYYKVEDTNKNYANATGKSTVEIKKVPLVLTPEAESRVYKEGDTSAVVKDIENVATGVNNETISVSGMKGTFLEGDNPTDQAGDNRVVRVEKDDNFNVSGSTTFKTSNYDITINDTNASITQEEVNNLTVKPYKGVYDGNGHNITVNSPTTGSITYYVGDACNINSDNLDGCTELTEGNYYKNVGTYTVYYVFVDENSNYQNAKGSSTVTITPRTVYVTPSANNKEYDGTDDATVNDVSNLKTGVGSETISVSGLTGSFDSADVGNNKLVTITNKDKAVITADENTSLENYIVVINDTSASITPKDQNNITVKPYVGYYDGKTHNIEVSGEYVNNVKYYADEAHTKEISGYKDVTLENDGTYTVYYVVEDTNTNYRNLTGSSTVKIMPLDITVTPTANNKVYDGNTDATVNDINSFKTGVGNEAISITGLTGEFDTADVGDGKTVTITNKDSATINADNDDTKLTNYKITINDTTAKITATSLSGITSSPYSGVYDGDGHNISVNVGKLENTTITYYKDASLSEELNEDNYYKNAGEYTVYYKVTCANYLPFTGSNTVTITKKDVDIYTTGTNREYKEGDVSDTIKDISNIKTGVKDESIVSITGLTGEFDDDVAGDNKYVSVFTSKAKVTYAYGTLETNYNLIYHDTTASIYTVETVDYHVNPYEGTYDGEAHNITFDSNYISSVEYYAGDGCAIENGKLNDSCQLLSDYKGEKDVKRGSDNKEVKYDIYYKVSDTNPSYSGAVGKSYILIHPAKVTVNLTANDKEYDGTTDVTVNKKDSYNTNVNNETFKLDLANQKFEDENVGSQKQVELDYTISGSDPFKESNYNITINMPKASITPIDITVSVGTYFMDVNGEEPTIELITTGTIVEKDKEEFEKQVKYVLGTHDKVGVYTIDISKYENKYGNYNITYIPGKLIVREGNNKIFKAVVDKSEIFKDATMSNTLDNLLSGDIMSESEQKEVHWGEIWLEITDTDVTKIPTASLEKIKQLAKSLVGDNPTIVYFDAMLYKISDLYDPTEIHEPKVGINISIKLPDELINSDSSMVRTYKIIRYHEIDGSVMYLDTTYDEKTHTISFTTDKFSTFALAYKDTKKPNNGGNTGDNTNGGSGTTNNNTGNTSNKKDEYTPLSCEDYMKSKDWTWDNKSGKCVYRVSNTRSK